MLQATTNPQKGKAKGQSVKTTHGQGINIPKKIQIEEWTRLLFIEWFQGTYSIKSTKHIYLMIFIGVKLDSHK